MIYIFDKKQAIIKVLTNDDFTAAHLNFKINTATTFEFSLPASKELPSGSKYVATPHPLNDSKFIMLRLTERVDNTETIDYSAYELAYQELSTDGYIEDKRPQNQGALNLMKIALDGSNWELNNVNVSGTATTNFYYVDRLSAISKVVDLLGGEIVFYIEIQGNVISGRYMDYLARQGTDTSKVFASGSSLLTVERQSDTSNIYTAILPRGKGEEIDNGDADTPDGYGRRINIADVEWKKSAGNPLDKPKGSIVLSDPDATAEWGQINGNARLLLQTYDDIDDVNVLISSAYKTLQSVNHPQIQYSATVANVGGLSLGDTVLIMHGDRDLSYKTRVFEVKYDLLSPDQTELSLGDDLSSNSITSQLNNLDAVADTTSSQTQWTINQIGRPGTTYGATAPDSPKVGDIWFKYLADGGTEIYRWNGNIWELLASPTTADDIATAVDDAVTQANTHTDEVKQGLSSDIATAKSQAASQASTAEANAKSAATSQFAQEQSALSAAKTDLTNSIASEASARNQAVAAANSQAQTYANQAKADAMSAASSADGVIRTAISSSADSLSATITQNKSSADSGISTAQTTAQAAVDGLALKVSKTDYDQKTGDLSTKINDVKQTADSSAQTIADIKIADGKQDARMAEIENTASGLKSTVSDISTAQGKQSGYISTLQQRADGFDATVTKVNNLSTGDRNYILDTGNQKTQTSNGNDSQDFYNQAIFYSPIKNWGIANGDYIISFDWTLKTALSSDMQASVFFNQSPWQAQNFTVKSGQLTGHVDLKFKLNPGILTATNDVTSLTFRITSQMASGNTITYSNLFMKSGTISTTWTPAPEDLSSATAKAQLTADNAALAISDYKTNADGRISQAQADITATAKQVATKVSQTDYDQKTGDLTTAVSKAQTTADGVVTTVGNYKTSNDARVKATETSIAQNAKDITARVTQTDYDNNNSNLNTRFTKVEATADGASTTVGKLQTTVNNLGQINQLFNTEFSPDFAGWYNKYPNPLPSDTVTTELTKVGVDGFGSNVVSHKGGGVWLANGPIAITQGTPISISARVSVPKAVTTGVPLALYVMAFDSSGNRILSQGYNIPTNQLTSTPTTFKYENIVMPSNATQVYYLWGWNTNDEVYISQPMLVFSDHVGTYVQGNYNNNAALAQVKITADSISNFVRDSSGNISSNFQTALSKTSIITGSTLASSIQKQTATQISSAITDNNGKIISLINQDTSGVQIAGKNIILNGVTTVTDAFKVGQANIANGAIGTAQIGDAAITNAKIADLDVSKITGNVSNFIQSNWNGVYASTTIDGSGMSIDAGNTTTKFDTTGAHYSNSSGMRATYSFGKWSDSNSNATSATGLYLGATGSSNGFINILGTSGAAALVLAGSTMDYGANLNVMRGALNSYVNVNIREQLHFKGNKYNSPSYIEINESNRTFNFFTGGGSVGGGNYFYFNQKVISAGTFSSTSVLSKKNVIGAYEEDALGEIVKTQLVNFTYKNRPDEIQVSPIIDDVNTDKEYYIPKTILGQDNKYVDMYSMISMAWKAIQQLNEKIGEK
ncbi:hypothetical protein EFN46_08790 [Leuconostoc pseudomesenteroides]|uniref:phage tail spike protein n=1 Tax=Leuconostoc pseudomesenteroides TaxID=33968 RepID=UPI0021AA9970|nr:phage tail spike protein [Leuconostoc pseudomesenteroides]MCT4388296.1 hypothetical protein [Leuconostoc pseudomesenteroides]